MIQAFKAGTHNGCKHAERFETEIVFDHIHTAELGQRPFVLRGDSGTYTCDALIICYGRLCNILVYSLKRLPKGKGSAPAQPMTDFFYRKQKSP